MSKKKINFSKEGIGEFFFRHVEKLFFGLACGLILLFVWFGVKTPKFDEITPKEMLTQSEQADRFINDDSHWNQLSEHRVADTGAGDRIRNAATVDPDTYSFRHIFGTAVFTREPRRDPELVGVKNFTTKYLRAQVARKTKGGSGLALAGIRSLPDSPLEVPGDQMMETFSYRTDDLPNDVSLLTVNAVVGMALVDHKQQLTNYRENFQFQRGYDSARDVPEYAFIEVQRKTNDEGAEWEPITAHIYEVTPKYLAEAAKELAAEDYLIPTLAMPIPPILGIDYRQFSLPKEIPTRDLLADTNPRGAGAGNRNRDDSKEEEDEDDPWGKDDNTKSGDDASDPAASADEDAADEEEIIPYRLVRFYDLEPKDVGKTYYYRLRVWLKDPNNPQAVNADIASTMEDSNKSGGVGLGGGGSMADGGPPGGGGDDNKKMAQPKKPLSEYDLSRDVRLRLKDEEVEVPEDIEDEMKELFKLARPTEWVEAQQPVTITSGFETFVAGPVDAPPVIRVDGGVFSATEPSVTIVANSFQDDLGVFVPAETETLRGSLLNFEAVTNLLDPISGTIKEVFAEIDSRNRKRGRRFETDAVVLDIMGGHRQPFSRGRDIFFAPGECLIMDRNGNIHLHNNIEDTTAYRHSNFVSSANTLIREEASGNRRNDDDDDDDDDMGGGGRGRGGGGRG